MTPRKSPPKPIAVSQAEKAAAVPTKVTQPAIPADVKFGNMLIAERDTAVVEMQALQSQLAARNGQFERDMERLNAEYTADYKSLSEQINEQSRISQAADAALEALKADTMAQVEKGEGE